MNCQRVNRSSKPAGWLHSLVCAECRAARRTDDLLSFGIVQLRKQSFAHIALNRTLAALDLSSIREDYAHWQRLRRRTLMRCAAVAAATAGCIGWFRYMDWMPAELPSSTPKQETHRYTALAARVKVRSLNFNSIFNFIQGLEHPEKSNILPQAEVIRRFVADNAPLLHVLGADLTTPYHEGIPLSRQKQTGDVFRVQPLFALLQADAVWKASQGDRSGEIGSALKLIAFSQNIAGGGSYIARLVGTEWQNRGRRLLWRLVPDMSAAESLQACEQMEAIRKRHVPLLAMLRWERDSGVSIRQDLLLTPDWRWNIANDFVRRDSVMPGVERLLTAASLYTLSNRRILQNYGAEMDKVEADWSRPYSSGDALPSVDRQDRINKMFKYGGEYDEPATPAFPRARFGDAENETQNALLTAALALHAYRLDHGAYPSTLQALYPKYLSEIPADPFKPGTVLHYVQAHAEFFSQDEAMRVDAGTKSSDGTVTFPPYLLYSLGPDGVDQHGAVIVRQPQPYDPKAPSLPTSFSESCKVLADSKGDIVAGVNF